MKSFAVKLGPPIPNVAIDSFSKLPVTISDLENMWRIVGPSVERNIQLPLWQIICAAYIEGLIHGDALAKKESDDSTLLPIY